MRTLVENLQQAQTSRIALGGSGMPNEDFKAAIRAGVNIVHVNTELRLAGRQGLERGLAVRLFTNPVP